MDFFQQIDNIALLEPAAHFELFRSISNALNSKDSGIQAVGRNHLIKVIDVWEDVPSTLKPMWEDLIEAVGFYPYIEKYKMTLTDLDARIRQEYHRSEYIFDKTLHSKQKELSDLILSKQKPFNMERYQRFENLPEELKIILKRNAVSIKDQLELLPIIRAMLIDPHRRGDIVWSELRDRNLYNHLCIIFDLVKDRFVEGNDKNVLISTKWMATQTVSYIYSKNIRQMIVERVAYRAKEYLKKNVPNSADMHFSSQQFLVEYPEMARQFADEAVETIFKFQKNWLQYKIPKWLNVVDSLQKYIAAELGMEAGDYSFIAEAIENEFTAANIQILTEFGIPSSAIRKILDRYGHHLKGLTEDQVVAAIIRNRELINRCLRSLSMTKLSTPTGLHAMILRQIFKLTSFCCWTSLIIRLLLLMMFIRRFWSKLRTSKSMRVKTDF